MTDRPLLIQIPFSHNCIKVRRALELKGIAFDRLDIPPADRSPVFEASGQRLVPALVHRGISTADSTAILLRMEETWPDARPLVPRDPAARAECLVLEDWADAAFMALTRRLAYWNVFQQPGMLASMFYPGERGLAVKVKERVARRLVARRFRVEAARSVRDEETARRAAGLAMDRLGVRPFLVGDSITIADVALAAMSWPLGASAPEVRDDAAVTALLAWGKTILEDPS